VGGNPGIGLSVLAGIVLPLWEAGQGRVVANESLLVLDDDPGFGRMLIGDFSSTRAALALYGE